MDLEDRIAKALRANTLLEEVFDGWDDDAAPGLRDEVVTATRAACERLAAEYLREMGDYLAGCLLVIESKLDMRARVPELSQVPKVDRERLRARADAIVLELRDGVFGK